MIVDCELSWIVVEQWLAFGTPTRVIRVRFPPDWLLHHGDNRGRHSANHNFLPDMHLSVPVLRVTACLSLFKMSGDIWYIVRVV